MIKTTMDLLNIYNRYLNLFPDEIDATRRSNLEKGKEEVKRLVEYDLQYIKNTSQNVKKRNSKIKFFKFDQDMNYAIKKGFQNDGETENELSFYYAHWYMAKKIVEYLAEMLLTSFDELAREIRKVTEYETANSEKKPHYILYLRAYYDFHGYVQNIRAVLLQYNDLYVRLVTLLDSTYSERPVTIFQSSTNTRELYYAVEDLLLRGNWGRLTGFSLLRSATEINILQTLFDLRESKEYNDYEILDQIHVDDVCAAIVNLSLNDFQIDTLQRLYDWQSKYIHLGIRMNEYLIWFVYLYSGGLINQFYFHITTSRDKILRKLEEKGKIKLEKKSEE